ncbi:mediator of DNA damage checkpoint protein 1-like [Loxodonta africana]|uniref:mediator of DNA damage checkpoint protein 1-like n=1 Tax=Loxodonta africana TaxID=9785 RepID=UPI0030D16420
MDPFHRQSQPPEYLAQNTGTFLLAPDPSRCCPWTQGNPAWTTGSVPLAPDPSRHLLWHSGDPAQNLGLFRLALDTSREGYLQHTGGPAQTTGPFPPATNNSCLLPRPQVDPAGALGPSPLAPNFSCCPPLSPVYLAWVQGDQALTPGSRPPGPLPVDPRTTSGSPDPRPLPTISQPSCHSPGPRGDPAQTPDPVPPAPDPHRHPPRQQEDPTRTPGPFPWAQYPSRCLLLLQTPPVGSGPFPMPFSATRETRPDLRPLQLAPDPSRGLLWQPGDKTQTPGPFPPALDPSHPLMTTPTPNQGIQGPRLGRQPQSPGHPVRSPGPFLLALNPTRHLPRPGGNPAGTPGPFVPDANTCSSMDLARTPGSFLQLPDPFPGGRKETHPGPQAPSAGFRPIQPPAMAPRGHGPDHSPLPAGFRPILLLAATTRVPHQDPRPPPTSSEPIPQAPDPSCCPPWQSGDPVLNSGPFLLPPNHFCHCREPRGNPAQMPRSLFAGSGLLTLPLDPSYHPPQHPRDPARTPGSFPLAPDTSRHRSLHPGDPDRTTAPFPPALDPSHLLRTPPNAPHSPQGTSRDPRPLPPGSSPSHQPPAASAPRLPSPDPGSFCQLQTSPVTHYNTKETGVGQQDFSLWLQTTTSAIPVPKRTQPGPQASSPSLQIPGATLQPPRDQVQTKAPSLVSGTSYHLLWLPGYPAWISGPFPESPDPSRGHPCTLGDLAQTPSSVLPAPDPSHHPPKHPRELAGFQTPHPRPPPPPAGAQKLLGLPPGPICLLQTTPATHRGTKGDPDQKTGPFQPALHPSPPPLEPPGDQAQTQGPPSPLLWSLLPPGKAPRGPNPSHHPFKGPGQKPRPLLSDSEPLPPRPPEEQNLTPGSFLLAPDLFRLRLWPLGYLAGTQASSAAPDPSSHPPLHPREPGDPRSLPVHSRPLSSQPGAHRNPAKILDPFCRLWTPPNTRRDTQGTRLGRQAPSLLLWVPSACCRTLPPLTVDPREPGPNSPRISTGSASLPPTVVTRGSSPDPRSLPPGSRPLLPLPVDPRGTRPLKPLPMDPRVPGPEPRLSLTGIGLLPLPTAPPKGPSLSSLALDPYRCSPGPRRDTSQIPGLFRWLLTPPVMCRGTQGTWTRPQSPSFLLRTTSATTLGTRGPGLDSRTLAMALDPSSHVLQHREDKAQTKVRFPAAPDNSSRCPRGPRLDPRPLPTCSSLSCNSFWQQGDPAQIPGPFLLPAAAARVPDYLSSYPLRHQGDPTRTSGPLLLAPDPFCHRNDTDPRLTLPLPATVLKGPGLERRPFFSAYDSSSHPTQPPECLACSPSPFGPASTTVTLKDLAPTLDPFLPAPDPSHHFCATHPSPKGTTPGPQAPSHWLWALLSPRWHPGYLAQCPDAFQLDPDSSCHPL